MDSAMSATQATFTSRHPQGSRLLAAALLATLGLYLFSERDVLADGVREEWAGLLFWIALAIIINLFPVPAAEVQLALDLPILMAVALLYPPPLATATAMVAALDLRELRGSVSTSRALFNRAQVAFSVLIASVTFRFFGGELHRWSNALMGTTAALGATYLSNVTLVAAYTSLRKGTSWLRSVQGLTIGGVGGFLATYLSCGALSLLLALLFKEMGPWPVVLLLAPILYARQMLVRQRQLEAVTNTLRERERLLERLSQQIVDERRDERIRLAADLHDDLLQSLTHAWMFSTLVAKEVPETGPVEADARQVLKGCEQSLTTLRSIIRSLQDSAVGSRGLVPTLDALVRDLRLSGARGICLDAPRDVILPGDLQLIIYQVARESLLNAVRHADAERVNIRLSVDQQFASIEVSDDGRGFDPKEVDTCAHFGLGLMGERVRMAGGSLKVNTAKGLGTTILARLPVEGLKEKG